MKKKNKKKYRPMKIESYEKLLGINSILFVGSWGDYLAFLYNEFNFVPPEKTAMCSGHMQLLVSDTGYEFYIIWLPKYRKDNHKDLGVLIHECVHVAITALDARGIPISEANQEMVSFVTQYFSSQFTKGLNKLLS